jgi:hypothetical protein
MGINLLNAEGGAPLNDAGLLIGIIGIAIGVICLALLAITYRAKIGAFFVKIFGKREKAEKPTTETAPEPIHVSRGTVVSAQSNVYDNITAGSYGRISGAEKIIAERNTGARSIDEILREKEIAATKRAEDNAASNAIISDKLDKLANKDVKDTHVSGVVSNKLSAREQAKKEKEEMEAINRIGGKLHNKELLTEVHGSGSMTSGKSDTDILAETARIRNVGFITEVQAKQNTVSTEQKNAQDNADYEKIGSIVTGLRNTTVTGGNNG